MRFAVLALLAFIPACQADETVRTYGAAAREWTLVEINGQPFNASATLTFPDGDTIAGKAPCNRYSANMTVPYPWFEVGLILATKMACGDLRKETEYFTILRQMTLSEVLGDVLILNTPEGKNMVFKADD
ncbi:MAG: META domain-containing protein [Ascidiaceihabitans sp.]|jgi:heat shock protein HslJ|nr:META domain-containing protein [Ascidiaceihabitans sp.]